MPWQLLRNVRRCPWQACWLLAAMGAVGCGGAAKATEAPAPAEAAEPAPQNADSDVLEEQESAGEPSSYQPGAAAPAAAAEPSSTGKKERRSEGGPADLSRAEADLVRAQQQLDALYVETARGDSAAADRESAGAGEAPAKKPATRSGMPRCGDACRAFGSLDRAASAICRIAGESSDRCERARSVVEEYRSRVAACHCAATSTE